MRGLGDISAIDTRALPSLPDNPSVVDSDHMIFLTASTFTRLLVSTHIAYAYEPWHHHRLRPNQAGDIERLSLHVTTCQRPGVAS